ncbi:MAG: FhaA domain-containing protein [Solirubrobacteraceae bacterium]
MSVLKSLETKIAGLVEGAFGRAFRSELRPVEIARKLAREMEEHKAVSVSRVYVPNEYAVYVSPDDRERFVDYEEALVKELEGYLLEHARLEKLALLSRPQVTFNTDGRLSLGEFGIQARLVKPAADDRAEPEQGEAGHTMIYSADRLRHAAGHPPAQSAKALVVSEGRRLVVGRSGAVIGRSRDCDIVLGDSNVSRRHAEVRPTEEGWTIVDLDSTNGVTVNGRPIRGSAPLRGGERIELGTAKVRFELE